MVVSEHPGGGPDRAAVGLAAHLNESRSAIELQMFGCSATDILNGLVLYVPATDDINGARTRVASIPATATSRHQPWSVSLDAAAFAAPGVSIDQPAVVASIIDLDPSLMFWAVADAQVNALSNAEVIVDIGRVIRLRVGELLGLGSETLTGGTDPNLVVAVPVVTHRSDYCRVDAAPGSSVR